jgi:hypothetical protein
MDINSTCKAILCKLTRKPPFLGTATAGFFPPRGKFLSFEAIPIFQLDEILSTTKY